MFFSAHFTWYCHKFFSFSSILPSFLLVRIIFIDLSSSTLIFFLYQLKYTVDFIVIFFNFGYCTFRISVSSVAQSCPTLCDHMDCSTPGLPVHHQLPELAQTHIHRVGDAIQPSHPLSSPSPPTFNLSQHQVLF